MSPWLLPLVPGLPLLAAVLLGLGLATGRIGGEASERLTARLAVGACAGSFGLAVLAAGLRWTDRIPDYLALGNWLSSGRYRIEISFLADGLSLALSLLFGLLIWIAARFSIHYLHREPGYHRFFLVLSLFAGAMQLLVLAGNAPLTFMGWELAGVSSYLLIAYAYDRTTAAGNATRAFVTNRIGDAGFVAGIALAFAWTGSVEWPAVLAQSARLPSWDAGLLAACFLLAAMAKSAQVPLSPWLARAMEGPTPSSALFYGGVMIHAGVYLLLRLEPLFEHSPAAMALMAAVGLMTAGYGWMCGLVQTDVKSALVFSTLGQVGLMVLECGLGWWQLAAWHLGAHAVVRFHQFLTAPSLMHAVRDLPARPVPAWLGDHGGLYWTALRRFWLEEWGDRLVVEPAGHLAADLQLFDRTVVEPLVGLPAPAVETLAPLAEREEPHLAAEAGRGSGRSAAGGLPRLLIHGVAGLLHWFEEHLVLRGMGGRLRSGGRLLGTRLNRIEANLAEPRYLILLVVLTLLATL